MTREEALQHFKAYKENLLKDYQMQFFEKLQKKQKQLEETVLESFVKLKEEIKRVEKPEMVYFQVSLLRVDLLMRKYTFLLHAYDRRWYLDEEPVNVQFDLSFLFQDLNTIWDKLISESKRYVGKINAYDVNQIIFEEAIKANKLIAHSLRFILKDMENQPVFKNIGVEKFWLFRWGEYRDESEIIIQIDRQPKVQKDWEEALEQVEEREDHLIYSYWYEGKLNGGDLTQKQLHFAKFENCFLEEVNFTQTAFMGGVFRDCQLKKCCFKEAMLKHADFRGSHFEEVDFEGADLTDAVFNDVDVPYIHLSPTQLQVIRIERS